MIHEKRKQDSFFSPILVSFHLFLWKIVTLYTWDDHWKPPQKKKKKKRDDHWKNGFNDKRRYGCVSANQFSSLTGKKSYKFETITTDFGFSSRGKHLPLSQSKKKKISKCWYNRAGECVFVFLPSIATLCIGPLKNFGFNHHAYTYYHTPNPKIISLKKIGQNWSLPFPGKINSILPSFSN